MVFKIDKNKWEEMMNWSLKNLQSDTFSLKDGRPPKFIIKNKNDAIVFALKWADYIK